MNILTADTKHKLASNELLMKSAIKIGRRYSFDEHHALQTAKLALSLFDKIEQLHGLGNHERDILLASALLHDIGDSVSVKGHHRHSMRLILKEALPGFTGTEMRVIANTARYHRKSEPAGNHSNFAELPEEHKETVRKLASILRIADLLDREHLSRVEHINVFIKNSTVYIELTGRGRVLLEKAAVEKKTAMFSNVYGLDVELII